MNELKERAELIDRLGSAMYYGESHIGRVPGLLKNVLEKGAWREFVTKKGEHVTHTDFKVFVTEEPLRGLGATLEMIKGIASKDTDPELEILLGKALKLPRGNPEKTNQYSANVFNEHISRIEEREPSQLSFSEEEEEEPKEEKKKREQYGRKVSQLKNKNPELYAQVQRNEKTINEAAIEAGIYPKQLTINLDNPQSAARTIREKASPEFLDELRRLLAHEN